MALPRNLPLKVVYSVGPDGPREIAKPAPGESTSTSAKSNAGSPVKSGAKSGAKSPDVVKVRRETQGRRGKTVTTVSGIPVRPSALDAIASALKQKCGAGGAVKDGVIEIQGDHREKVKTELEARGFVVKLAGG